MDSYGGLYSKLEMYYPSKITMDQRFLDFVYTVVFIMIRFRAGVSSRTRHWVNYMAINMYKDDFAPCFDDVGKYSFFGKEAFENKIPYCRKF